MIKSILINNFVLIDELEINFDRGLNVLTGETGSGKSVIIDAIDLAFGARASKDQIRTGETRALIELNICLSNDFPLEILEENGIELDDSRILAISREITQNTTRSRINGVLVTQNFVQSLRSHLIDIHSQNETYNYMQPKAHMDLLDNFGKDAHKTLLNNYKKVFSLYKSTEKELETAKLQLQNGEQKLEFLKFQIDEITNARIENINEYDELIQERAILLNSEELREISYSGYETLYNQDNSILDVINSLKIRLVKASEYDEKFLQLAETLDLSAINLKETANELRNYAENLEIDPERLNQAQERIELLDKLKRKYGHDLSDILKNLEKFTIELEEINFSDEKIRELSRNIVEVRKEAEFLAKNLSESRKNLAETLSNAIQEKLVKLEMPKVRFEIKVDTLDEISTKGIDNVEFLISPNIGEPLKPLAKIASGGEISRVTLAIKTVFAKSDSVNTVIFDEIDAGISGKTSQSVAESLAELGFSHQVLCITHQPIIAAMANRHFYIQKIQNEASTKILIDELSHDGRINALAGLASGSNRDEDALKFASKLLEQANTFKEKIIVNLC